MKWLNDNRMKLIVVGFVNVALLIQPAIGSDSEGVRPIADAGLPRYAAQDPVVLDGTGSYDPDNSGTLSFMWRQISGPSVIISNSDTAAPTIRGFTQTDVIQECEFELIVSNGEMTSLADTVKVIIVPDFGINKLIHLNPPFDPNKPTWISFGGLGGCDNVGSNPSWFVDYPEGWGGWIVVDEKVNYIMFEQIKPYDFEACENIGDMLIVYLSSQAPDYKQPIQSDGHSAGGQPAIDIGIYLNETYADARYAVNRVTLFDATGYCRDYSISIDRFLASAVDGEQCWIDSYPSTLPGLHNKMDYGFQANVLTVWFDAARGSLGWQDKHDLCWIFYGNTLIDPELNNFNHGVIAGSFWSVIGPGKNLQLAFTPGVETYKFTWYGDEFSGYMDLYDEANHPGRLPEPVTLMAWRDSLDPNGALFTCKESENAVGYELLFGPDPYHVMDYNIASDTLTPPYEVISDFPFEETWWTIRARDKYGSTIYADPIRIDLENLPWPTIENLTTGQTYGYIQAAIDQAGPGDEIVIVPGTYQENIDLEGKNLTVTSTDPNDPTVVAATVINGVGQRPVVTLSRGQGAGCVLAGLTITGETVGISCGDASPTIRNCTIESTGPIVIEFLYGYEPIIIDCTILGSMREVYDPRLGLVALWKMDETEGSIAYDSIGINDGICHGEPLWQPAGGMLAGALEFDGIDDYIATDFVLDPSFGAFSVFAWIKGGAPGQVIISQTDDTFSGCGETWLGMDVSSGYLITGLVPPPLGRFNPEPLVSQAIITDDQWHHVGFVWDGSYRFLYVDGVEVAKDTKALTQALMYSNGGLYIGADKDLDATSFFSGSIDDVRIYNVALSAERIAGLAQ